MVFEEVQSDLEAQGYEIQPFILPAAGVNAPHRRDRVWFVAYRNATNATGKGSGRELQQGQGQGEEGSEQFEGICQPKELGGLRDATNANNKGLEGGAGKRIQENEGRKGGSRKLRQLTRESWGDWERFPTQSPLCSGNDGLSSELDGITFSKWRNESIKAAGNAIVPQVALQIFKAIEQYEELRLRQAQG